LTVTKRSGGASHNVRKARNAHDGKEEKPPEQEGCKKTSRIGEGGPCEGIRGERLLEKFKTRKGIQRKVPPPALRRDQPKTTRKNERGRKKDGVSCLRGERRRGVSIPKSRAGIV